MNEKNRNLVVRIVSALVLLPLVLFLFFLGGLFTAALVAVASAAVARELYGLAGLPRLHPVALFGMLASASFSFFAHDPAANAQVMLGILVATPPVSLGLLTLAPPGKDLQKAAQLAAFAVLGPSYAGLCLSAVVALRALPGAEGFAWLLVALAVTWGNDTGAYFAGRLFGKNKLYPEVSPSKTWEGFWGGMAASVLACFAVRAFYPEVLRPIDCLLVGAIAGCLGPLGDLAESMIKRAFGAKDSGRLLPGHGGLLDRVDALLFNAPWVFAYAVILRALV